MSSIIDTSNGAMQTEIQVYQFNRQALSPSSAPQTDNAVSRNDSGQSANRLFANVDLNATKDLNKNSQISANKSATNTYVTTQNNQQNNQKIDSSFSQDRVNLSDQGKKAAHQDANNTLTKEEQAYVLELETRDKEVRVHEQAHAAVGGQYAGSPSYEYETGPNNRRYAKSGEVPIDVSALENPEDTIEKMKIVRAAALAPAQPSSQDIKIAGQASQLENQAKAEVSRQNRNTEINQDAPNSILTNNDTNTATTRKPTQLYIDISAYQPRGYFSASA